MKLQESQINKKWQKIVVECIETTKITSNKGPIRKADGVSDFPRKRIIKKDETIRKLKYFYIKTTENNYLEQRSSVYVPNFNFITH